MPLVDFLFIDALSEYTTITVPYSRILSFRYDTMALARVILTSICWIPLFILLFSIFLAPANYSVTKGNAVYLIYPGAGCIFVGLVGTFFINRSLVASRYILIFRLKDDKKQRALFRIPSRKKAQAFADQLNRNRNEVRSLAPEREIVKTTSPGRPLVLLTVYLVAHYLVYPWWLVLSRLIQPPGFSTEDPVLKYLSSVRLETLGFLYVLLGFLYQQGPVGLLSFLLLRWNNVVRQCAVFLLLLHAILPIMGPWYWDLLGFTTPHQDPCLAPFGSLVLHLVLAVVLGTQRDPTGKEE